MQRAKFVQIYASSFLLKEIKLEAGGLEGEGISISHLNSAFLCGIVTLYERRGIYGGFCHQRKIRPSKSWDFFSLSITYMCKYLKTITCTFLVRILKPLVFGSRPWLWPLLVIFGASSSQAATTSGKLSWAGPSPSPLSLWEVLDVRWPSPRLTGVPNAGRAGSSPLADQTPKITRGKSLTWGFRPGKEMREKEFKSEQPCWNIPGLLFPIEYWAMKAGSESTVPVEGEIIG